jgi:hypothetical protein
MVAIYLYVRWASICTSRSANSHPSQDPLHPAFNTESSVEAATPNTQSGTPLTLTKILYYGDESDGLGAPGSAEQSALM